MNSAPGEADPLLSFLRHILPAEGHYVYCWKRADTNWRQNSVTSLDELVRKVQALSAQGFDTYFACASYRSPNVRTADQVLGANALWLDIDAGPGKPYATAPDAARDLLRWCGEYKIPPPTVVLSGGGLHCYWVLDRTLGRAEWEGLAQRLKALTVSGGLHADPSRTADIASVLRPPTTLNYKRAPADPVPVGVLRSALSVAYLDSLLPQGIAVSQHVAAPRIERSGLNAEFMALPPDPPSYADAIADQCQWVRKAGREQRGNVIEPLWYALLGLVAFTEDAEDKAHEWSWGHAGYDYDATERKMEQVRAKQTGPTTCERFSGLWKEGCIGCPHAISTPLQLGRIRIPNQNKEEIPSSVEHTQSVAGPHHQGIPLPALQFPFFWGRNYSLWQRSKTPEGVDENKELYPYPLFIESLRRGEISGGSFTNLKHWRPHDGWCEVSLPSGDLTADGAYRVLGNNHIEVENNVQKAFTRYLSKSKMAYTAAKAVDLQHETFGWKPDNSFLLGESLLTRNGAAGVKGGLSEELKKLAPKITHGGDLAAWTGAAQPLFLPGFEYQGMAILAALAAPLMRFAPYPGAIYSIVHPLSGRGKTMSLEAATSIWGDDKCLSINHRDEKVTTGDTLRSQFRSMALFKSLPIIVDELRETDPEKLRGFILTFTDGNPSKGLTKDGKMRDLFGVWRTVMLSTSNKSLVDIVTVNNDAAAASRVFEVTADLPENLDVNSGIRIRSGLMTNYGVAGRAFIQALLKDGVLEWAEKTVKSLVDIFMLELQALGTEKSGGDRYVASFLACSTVAGILASREGVVDVPLPRMKAWALEQWSKQRRQIDAARKTPLEALSAFIREHWANTLVVDDEAHGRAQVFVRRQAIRDPLMMRFEVDTGRLLIDRNKVQKWALTENIHYGSLTHDLEKQRILTDRNAYKNLGAGSPDHKAVGQSRVWIIDTRHPAMSGELREMTDPQPRVFDRGRK